MHTASRASKSIRRLLFLSLFLSASFGVSSSARAEEAAAAKSASAEVKAAKGVASHEPVEEGQSFSAGTLVWVWSRIFNADGTTVQHVWKKDGSALGSVSFSVQ